MARSKKHAEHANHERWLISYADFITLLFAFFVVMFASSQTDKSKAQQVADAVKDALEHGGMPVVHQILGGTVDETGSGNAMKLGPGGVQKITSPKLKEIPESKVAVTNLMPSMEYLTKALAAEVKAGRVDVRLDARGLVVTLRQAAFFPSGGDDLAPAGMKTIEKIANTIRDLPNPVRLEGHTDSIPIHTSKFPSNWQLSAARSIAMLKAFTDQYGLPTDRFSAAGYAETKPIDSNDSAEGRAHNRRVDIVILDQLVIVQQGSSLPAQQKTAH